MEYLDLVIQDLENRVRKAITDLKGTLDPATYTVEKGVVDRLADDKAVKDAGGDPTPKRSPDFDTFTKSVVK